MSSVFSSQDQFCPFWDQFCGFAHIIRLGDHFCLAITFAVIQHLTIPFRYRIFLFFVKCDAAPTELARADTASQSNTVHFCASVCTLMFNHKGLVKNYNAMFYKSVIRFYVSEAKGSG